MSQPLMSRLLSAQLVRPNFCFPKFGSLGGVDKFEPVSGGGEMNHSKEAVGQLIISSSDGAVDLELSEHALDAVTLFVERPIMLDFHASV